MKRIFCVLLAAVFVAALGFTQEVRFDGYVNSGLGLWMSDQKGDDDPMVMAYGVDSERYIGRFRLNGAYTNANRTAGANFRLQAQGKGFTATSGDKYPVNTPALAFGYGWVNFKDVVTIKAGLVDDSTWQTADYIYNDDQSEGAGMLLKLTPTTGLDLGFGGFVATPNSSSNNNFFGVDLPSRIKYDEAKYTFSAAYTMDRVFRFMVSGRTYNKTGGDSKYGSSHALAELRILAVDGLTAIVVGEVDNLHDNDKIRDVNFYETIGYRTGNLGIGINAAQFIRNLPSGSSANDDLSVWINPWISYAFYEGAVVPRLDAVYLLGGYQDAENYHRRGFKPNYNNETYVVNVRPSVKFNLDSRASFEIGDSFYYSNAARNNGAKLNNPVITNVVYADVVVKF